QPLCGPTAAPVAAECKRTRRVSLTQRSYRVWRRLQRIDSSDDWLISMFPWRLVDAGGWTELCWKPPLLQELRTSLF
ncbi:hypothetical protein ANANG_G00313040, partial [Anguilla anguilla]